ncbi:Eco57I restriction-modification methylase domain-containing protein [Williamsia sterculiae]|uniref:site-specific DNA-methyltransferase (adenine-specific) n=1 Tax=Williamsia sterculiae TaxID=1344003 RepID=A0A1N7GGF3_9NOCA|nr:TaqI-like C-terminal specificity domain-containing protein [Williamsia sterculiae]SIS11673.1 N-6 DNA Methylase [Williamsia sterculiae]
MAHLFPPSALRKRAEEISTVDIIDRVDILRAWLLDYDTGTLKTDTEQGREGGYTEDVFVKVLGYKLKPDAHSTFEPKVGQEGKFPDGIIRVNGAEDLTAVVEYKRASADLDKPQKGPTYGNLSPVQQAFNYKSAHRVCPFVIVTNFFEFRLYSDNRMDFERWTLRDLVDPADDYLGFKKWYYLLKAENLVRTSGISSTESLLSEIRHEQLEIGKDFYKEYRDIRLELLRDIWRNNSGYRNHFDDAITKAQTIIDRFVFICFAEDGDLMRADTLARWLKDTDQMQGTSLWEEFKTLSWRVGHGHGYLDIPSGYGGDLFADDPELNALDIPDQPLRALAELGSRYNFKDDLTVTVLGHIFEQSVTDLEMIKAKAAGGELPTGEDDTLGRGRRKKDGIFYTGDYIVRYIVNATVGEYLRDKETELLKKHNLSGMTKDASFEKAERAAYTEYQHVLQSIRVLDPACGSGAFLVGVFNYLLAENKRVDDILGGTLTSQEDFVRSILSDNIYGVDLNEESVEITKLSLWLQTAIKNKPLTSLDQNIKCGNSIVNDSAASDAPFDWSEKFPNIMAEKPATKLKFAGENREPGFDVIVGNPPYVQLSQGGVESEELREHLVGRYGTSGGRLNTFIFFTLLGLDLLREDGRLGFIIPNTILTQEFYKVARKIIINRSRIEEIVEYPEMQFEDAVVENITLLLKNRPISPGRKPELFEVVAQTANTVTPVRAIDQRPYARARNNVFSLRGDAVTDAIDSLKKTTTIDKHYNINQAIALKGDRKASIKDEPAQTGEFYKLLDGRNINKYKIDWTGNWLEYDVSRIHSCKRKDIFEIDEKLFFRRTGVSIIAAYDNEQYFALNTLIVVTPKTDTPPLSLKALMVLMNSAVLNHYYGRKYKSTKTVFSEIQARTVGALPLPVEISGCDRVLAELADQITAALATESSKIHGYAKYLMASFGIEPRIAINAVGRANWKLLEMALKEFTTITQRQELFQHFDSVLDDVERSRKSYYTLVSRADAIVADAYGLTPALARMTQTED